MRISLIGANYFQEVLVLGSDLHCILLILRLLSGFEIFSRKGGHGQPMSYPPFMMGV